MSKRNEKTQPVRVPDPSFNVGELVDKATNRLDDLRKVGEHHLDEKFILYDTKYQVQFSAAKEAVGIALIAQEKAVAAALEGTKEAIIKNDANTDKRFDLLSEKIDGIAETISKSTGASGLYVTHTDLTIALDKLQAGIEASLRPLTTFMNTKQGSGEGMKNLYGWIVGGILFVITVATFIINYAK